MTTNVLIAFYSTYGHIHRMALAVAEGAESVPDSTVRLRRIAELEEARKALSAQDAYLRAQQAQADIPVVTHDDLRWADGIAWGTPTRYGNMSAQMKQFVDTTGSLWLKGELEDKATGIFTSTGRIEEFIEGANYAQHASKIGDGIAQLKDRIASVAKEGGQLRLTPRRFLAEGNFVL